MDEDPSKGECTKGASCTDPECFHKHPDNRSLLPIATLRCCRCGQWGHMKKHCTMWVPRLRVSKLAAVWDETGKDELLARLTMELEVFGELEGPPEWIDNGSKV